MNLPEVVSILYEFANNAAYLLITALGLIIILGMMNIINLAHGELMMMGAYIASIAFNSGVPFPIAVLMSFVGVGVFGAILERLVVRRFYGRELGALVVTWGISLIMTQGALILFGPSMPPVEVHMGSFRYGDFSYSNYRLLIVGLSIAFVVGLWALYRFTRFGLQARATMQNRFMARSLGIDTERINLVTFALGAALAGLGGALLAPLTAIRPLMGQQFVTPAFITVVIGGASNVIAGAIGSGTFLSLVQTPMGSLFGAYIGRIAIFVAALVVIRALPAGISALFEHVAVRRRASSGPVKGAARV